MYVPFDIKYSLRQGTVYYFQHRELTSSEPHYFVVLNSDPLSQQVLLMSVFTSKVENQLRGIKRAGHAEETLVKILPTEYSELSVESCVNCNKVFSKSLAELISQWGNIRKKPNDLPHDVLVKILVGVELSTAVAEEEKALIRDTKV
jgi:hypothetical protein